MTQITEFCHVSAVHSEENWILSLVSEQLIETNFERK